MDQFLLLFMIVIVFLHRLLDSGNDEPENSASEDKCTSFCSSPNCTSLNMPFIITNMDVSVDPCDDFYQFACGNFAKRLPKDVFSSLVTIGDLKLIQILLGALNTINLSADLVAFKKMKMYYDNCLDEAEIEKIGTAPLMNLLRKFGGWPVLLGEEWNEEAYDWKEVPSNIRNQGIDPVFPIQLNVDLDPMNSRNYSVQIYPSETNFDEATNNIAIEAYKLRMTEIALLLGAKRERAIIDMSDCVNFEVQLYKAQSSQSNPEIASPDKVTVTELSKKYPDIPWLDVINRMLNPSNVSVTAEELVVVWNPKFISKIGQILKNTSLKTIVNYQIMKIVSKLLGYMPGKFRKIQQMIGQQQPERHVFCWFEVKKSFGVALSSLYVKRYFDKQSKDKVIVLIHDILRETKSLLENVKWIDSQTRVEALAKVKAMRVIAAYPDELLDDAKVESLYENIQISPGNFFDNILKISTEKLNIRYKRLGQYVNEILTDVTDVNAQYAFSENQIYIFAGILRPPFYGLSWPEYMNYGSLGYTIGHEISHGFDTTGRKYDRNGNYGNWWTNRTSSEFERKARCMIDQYNNYTIKQINQSVNGKLTIGENIADSAGVKLAYRAYQSSLKDKQKGEQCIPNYNYTLNQMFWISAASVWCDRSSDQDLRYSMATDAHSPSEARVNIPFSNTDEFAFDFKCPVGSRMNPTKKCGVW